MSKLYTKYLEKKKENSNKFYLFKSGKFYLFIDEDARKISKITTLKLTILTKNIVKCGFPDNSFSKYQDIFKNLNYDIEVINEVADLVKQSKDHPIIKRIQKLDVNKISPMEALKLINDWKSMINHE